jgi:hypothetical protein
LPHVVASEPAPRSYPGGWALCAVIAALIGLLLLAGIPESRRSAGNGSDKLRHGWAEKRAAAAQTQQAPDAPR